MHTFISHLCDSIMTMGRPLHEINIVVPARRAALFIKKELASRHTTPFIAPHICTIEDLAQDMSHLTRASMTTLLFEFYAAYRAMCGEGKCDTFDVFMRWAPTLLADFNEIDRYMLSPDDVFSTLCEIERIEGWDLEMPLSPFMESHKEFWKMSEGLYHCFRERLLGQGIGYSGMIFRRAGENAIRSAASMVDDRLWVFAGLNAMSRAEEKIISYYIEKKNARIYYHCDDYYMSEGHSAGLFLRRLREDNVLGRDFSWVESGMREHKTMELISVTRTVTQSKAASKVLERLCEQDSDMKDTVVVLADEKQLVPMLSSIPPCIEAVNVTMGYPLSMLPTSGWVEAVMDMHTTPLRLHLSGYYHKDVMKILSHGLTHKWLTYNGVDYSMPIKMYIVSENVVDFSLNGFYEWYACKDKKNCLPEEIISRLNLLLSKADVTPLSCCEKIQDILLSIKQMSDSYDDMSMEYVYYSYEIFKMLHDYMSRYPYVESIFTMGQLYRQLSSSQTVDFYGEPLAGLQVMGLLETRLLNFKNVIITGVNEGTLPAARSENTYIPHDVKRYYGLPTYSEKDAIYSYHFFRLLQGASHISIIYDADESSKGVMEPSRYVQQLKHDMKGLWDIKEEVMAVSTGALPGRITTLPKSPYAIERTQDIMKRKISPSAIVSYMSCPMEFYYKRVLNMGDEETVDEIAEANTMGSIIHRVLQVLYTPFLNTTLTIESIKKMQMWVEKEVKCAFDELLKGRSYKAGSNFLAFQAVKRIVHNYLSCQMKEIEAGNDICVVALEENLSVNIELDGITVKLYGQADRIDMYNGVLRVVDYKTGRVESSDLNVEDMEILRSSYVSEDGEEHLFSYGKFFQVMFYAYLYIKMKEQEGIKIASFTAGIDSLRKPAGGVMPLKINGREHLTAMDIADYERKLCDVLREMIDKDVPYVELGTTYYDILS